MSEERQVSKNVIEVTDLSKAYGRVKALSGLTFSVAKGEIVGFLGPNGAGKSTTMRILCGMTGADSGEAQVCGVDLAEEEGEVRKHIGYLPENNPLPEDLRVSEYLKFRGRLKGLSGGRLRERLEATLNLCDLRRSASERLIGNLSKGYRQRVGIAEALLDEPKLLILDEPTIGLDPRQTGIIRKLLDRLRGETSFLLSSHVLSEVEASCDRMLILNRGRIVAEGTLQELQAEYLDNTVFEVVAGGERSVIEKIARNIDPLCELIDENPTTATGRKRFSFCTPQGESSAESILKEFVNQSVTQTREFNIARPDLESIFLKATKRSWEQTDSFRENLREVSATLQPDEEDEEGAR
ncbi:MAG: ABC transporter ATP-binding protein [Opitutae bacterium]|nr:ABC transporter ATP-binding protein [Opitutae bacterium]